MLSVVSRVVVWIVALPLLSSPLFAQHQADSDTSKIPLKRVLSDTSGGLKRIANPPPRALEGRPSTSRRDVQPARVGIDSSVTYSARYIESLRSESTIHLIGDAQVKYKNVTVKAGKITILWDKNLLIAEGLPDSTNGLAPDSVKIDKSTLPVFSDGKETMVGERMEYNFKSEKGRILRGRTAFQQGYYQGDAVKRVAPEVFNVLNGRYSTCDKAEPHYHFRGKKMKVIVGDKVIAKPVIFFIGKIPVAILPFAMFSTKENGRQSGLILPQFGSSPEEGRFLRNLGFYWATNDYMDMRFTLDFFERTGILFRTHMNYALRYNFTGSFSGSFTRKDFANRSERRWNLNINHNQQLGESASLRVNASFVSNNNFYRELSSNRRQVLRRQLVSNATFNKSWGQGKNSLVVNLKRTKDLETGSDLITLPNLQFTHNQSALIPFKKDESGRTKKEPRWFNFIQYRYRGLVLNTVRKDSSNDPDAEVNRRAEHDLTLTFTSPKKIFGWLSLTQSLVYDEDWFDRTKTFKLDTLTNRIESSKDVGFAARHLFRYSASASTNLFGTFFPHIGAIRAFRHKMTPSISFIYQPDFSSGFWGYYQTVRDTTGKEILKDRFAGSGARATPRGEQLSLSYSLNNLFQMKLGEGDKEKRIDLFNLDFSGGYNFAADSLNWQNLNTRFRATPRRNLNVSMSMTHSFYDTDDKGRTINRLLFNKGSFLNFLRLTSFRFDARWTLSGRKSTPAPAVAESERGAPQDLADLDPLGLGPTGESEDGFSPEGAFSALDRPWRATISFSYSLNRFNPLNPSRSAYIDLSNMEVQLTQKWRIGYKMRYDIERSEIADQRISFYRDLHCWEARFDWNPKGIGKGFYFKINIKAGHLRQVKVERRGGTTSIFRPF